MQGHLYRTFILCKSQIIFLGCLQAVMSAFLIIFSVFSVNGPDYSPTFVQVVTVVIESGMLFMGMSMFTVDYFRIDEKLTTACFICSTPKSVKAQVASKYFFVVIIGLFVYAANVLTDEFVVMITKGDASGMSVAFLMFCLLLVINAIELPFVFRFGAAKGASIKGAVFGSVMILLVIYGLFGDISFFLSDDPIGAIIEFSNGNGPKWAMAILPYAGVALYYLSYHISVKLWRKGLASYE